MHKKSFKQQVFNKKKRIWVLLKCLNRVEEDPKLAQELGCFWYSYDSFMINLKIFDGYTGVVNRDTTSRYLRLHKFIWKRLSKNLKQNIPEKFNFGNFTDQKNWSYYKCENFTQKTTEEEAKKWKYYDDFLKHPKKKNKSNFKIHQSPNEISNWTNIYSFQNHPTNIMNHPFYFQTQPLQQQQMYQIGNNSYQQLQQPTFNCPNNIFQPLQNLPYNINNNRNQQNVEIHNELNNQCPTVEPQLSTNENIIDKEKETNEKQETKEANKSQNKSKCLSLLDTSDDPDYNENYNNDSEPIENDLDFSIYKFNQQNISAVNESQVPKNDNPPAVDKLQEQKNNNSSTLSNLQEVDESKG